MTQLPRVIRVAGQRVTVHKYDELVRRDAEGHEEQLFGNFEPGDMTIGLIRGVARERERSTTLHECLHFLWNVARFHGDEDEEEIIGRLTPLMLSLIRENPGLLAYLREVTP